jgi:signal peptidase II
VQDQVAGQQPAGQQTGDPVDPTGSVEFVAPPGRTGRRLLVLGGAALTVYALDVASKAIVAAHLAYHPPVTVVPGVLDLELTRNPGAAFGMAGGATVLFTLVAVVVVAVIVRTARRLGSSGWALVLGLLLGGALGNLTDRLLRSPGPLRGQVVDWIHLHHWPIFNLADSAIVVGVVLALLLSAKGVRLDGSVDGAPVTADDARPAPPA